MAVEQYRLVYDGEAVRTGEMPVEQYAPSLLAFAEMLREAARAELGSEASLTVKIAPNKQRKGSADTQLVLVLGALASVMFHGNARAALLSVLDTVFGENGVLAWLIKIRELLKPKLEKQADGSFNVSQTQTTTTTETKQETTTVQPIIAYGPVFNIPGNVGRLIISDSFKHNVTSFTQPAREEGFTGIRLEDERGRDIGKIDRKQAQKLAHAESTFDPSVRLSDSIQRTKIKLVKPSLDETKTWEFKFSDTGKVLHARMADADCIEQVKAWATPFGAGAIMDVTLVMQQEQGPNNKLKVTGYTIIKVHGQPQPPPRDTQAGLPGT